MKHITISFLFFLFILKMNGQSQNVDSLVNVLNTHELSSEEKNQLYWDIMLCYWNSELDKTILSAADGLFFSEKEHNHLWSARFSRILGFSYIHKKLNDSSLYHLENAIEFAIKAKDKREENIAIVYMGTLCLQTGKYEQSLKHFLGVLSSLEELQQNNHLANALVQMATIYKFLYNPDKAFEYAKESIAVAEKHNLNYSKMVSLELMGDIYYNTLRLDSAEIYMLKAYEISHDMNDKVRIVTQTQMLANLYCALKEYDKAEEFAKECLNVASEFTTPQNSFMAWSALSKINFEQKKYKESERYAYKIWETDSTNSFWAETASLLLCSTYIFLNEHQKAYHYLDKYKEFRDQISDEKLYESLAEVEVKYETEKKEMRIASLEKERKLYVWLGIGAVILLFSSGMALWFKIRDLQKERQLAASNALQEGEMGERERIAGELHDRLLGSLSAVKSEIGNADIGEKLNGCIDEVRRISRNLMPLPLRSGIKTALEDFTTQFPNVRFHFFGQENRIGKRIEFAIYCCANELVTNAIRHSGADSINVQLVQDKNHVALTVQDDGCGFDEKTVTKGVGLQSICDRVTSCNGKMDIFSSPDKGTETIIEINY